MYSTVQLLNVRGVFHNFASLWGEAIGTVQSGLTRESLTPKHTDSRSAHFYRARYMLSFLVRTATVVSLYPSL